LSALEHGPRIGTARVALERMVHPCHPATRGACTLRVCPLLRRDPALSRSLAARIPEERVESLRYDLATALKPTTRRAVGGQ
jgi:hypothetical protein